MTIPELKTPEDFQRWRKDLIRNTLKTCKEPTALADALDRALFPTSYGNVGVGTIPPTVA